MTLIHIGVQNGKTFPALTLFDSVRKAAYRTLKHCPAYYPSFVSDPRYRKTLLCTPTSGQRDRAGLRAMGT